MGYDYLDDVAVADVAFRAWGDTLSAVFEQACRATVNVMVADLASVLPRDTRVVEMRAGAADLLLYDLLTQILYLKDAERLLVVPADLAVCTTSDYVQVSGRLVGETVDSQRHELIVDVKAITLHRLSVRQHAGGWAAQVVLDT